jgi:hypothetical protein
MRLALSISAGVINGVLQVTDTADVDEVTLDDDGSNVLVNGNAFPHSQITGGIHIQVGSGVGNFDTVEILATALPVMIDGQFDLGHLNLGKAGSVQGIKAPVTMINFNGEDFGAMTVDDSKDTSPRTATLNVVNGVGTISDLAPATITYDATSQDDLTVFGGPGGNTFNIFGTFNGVHGPLQGIGSTTINSGLGADTVHGQRVRYRGGTSHRGPERARPGERRRLRPGQRHPGWRSVRLQRVLLHRPDGERFRRHRTGAVCPAGRHDRLPVRGRQRHRRQ